MAEEVRAAIEAYQVADAELSAAAARVKPGSREHLADWHKNADSFEAAARDFAKFLPHSQEQANG